ncbi:MAG: DUF6323 family protein [Candidatus Xenobiia bacterium LiM19]
MENDFSLLPEVFMRKQAVVEVVECNDKTLRYGLMLSPSDAKELVETRNEELSRYGRMEFGGGMLKKLIEEFCDSPYLSQQEYLNTLSELTETFYYFKNESLDLISDDELIACMKDCFNNRCSGSIELLQGREMEKMAGNLRRGGEECSNSDTYYEEYMEYYYEEGCR